MKHQTMQDLIEQLIGYTFSQQLAAEIEETASSRKHKTLTAEVRIDLNSKVMFEVQDRHTGYVYRTESIFDALDKYYLL